MSSGNSSIIKEIKEYARLRMEYYKVEGGDQFNSRFSGVVAALLNNILIAIVFGFFYFFMMIFLGFVIAEIYGDGDARFFVGFGTVFIIQLMLLLWFMYFGKTYLKRKISDKIAGLLIEKTDEKEDDNE